MRVEEMSGSPDEDLSQDEEESEEEKDETSFVGVEDQEVDQWDSQIYKDRKTLGEAQKSPDGARRSIESQHQETLRDEHTLVEQEEMEHDQLGRVVSRQR
jgi:hypothetical protein